MITDFIPSTRAFHRPLPASRNFGKSPLIQFNIADTPFFTVSQLNRIASGGNAIERIVFTTPFKTDMNFTQVPAM